MKIASSNIPNPRLLRSRPAQHLLAVLVAHRAYESETRAVERFDNTAPQPMGMTVRLLEKNLPLMSEQQHTYRNALDALAAFGYVRESSELRSRVDGSLLGEERFSVTAAGVTFYSRYGSTIFGGFAPFVERAMIGSSKSPKAFFLRVLTGVGILATTWMMYRSQVVPESAVAYFGFAAIVAFALGIIPALAHLPAEHKLRRAFDREQRADFTAEQARARLVVEEPMAQVSEPVTRPDVIDNARPEEIEAVTEPTVEPAQVEASPIGVRTLIHALINGRI